MSRPHERNNGMTDRPFGTSTAPGSYSESEGSTTDVAKDQAKNLAGDAKQGGQQVAQTAKEQTQQVASEAKDQARQLFQQVRGEFGDQAANQHQRAASGLRSLGDELGSMARGESSQQGLASDLAQQAADRVGSLAGWLESREPGDVLGEVTSFARRKPGTFLAAAAAIGFLGGRLTRGIAAESSDGGGSSGSGAPMAQGTMRASGTDFSTGSAGYNRGAATAAPQATTQPTPLPDEPAWPAPDGAVPPPAPGATTGLAAGPGEERV
jgi:hypothetical protein